MASKVPERNWTEREQKLARIAFQLVLAATDDPVFCRRSTEQKAAWVAGQLKDCGFPTSPCGANWGRLIEPE